MVNWRRRIPLKNGGSARLRELFPITKEQEQKKNKNKKKINNAPLIDT